MAQGVKKIKKKLDVYEDDIVGRDLDLEKIVGVLLDSNVRQNVSFLSIVGIGGLGKTALAQLVFNDARVKTAFPLRLWTCVADENPELLDVQGVLSKILASATGHKKDEECTMEGLQRQLREKLAGNKFLLVLDDVWTENSEIWRTLIQFLMGGQRGSWIVVTTRSQETARIIGDGPRHDLQGLSKENSRCLFKRVAFGSQHSNPPEDLVKIGQDIVEECANVPLAIRVVGSLLYGQDKPKWLSIQKIGLAKGCQKNIMPILKLSYYQLESRLKSCFAYCAVFPKDFKMKKETLIRLWMAQGYISLDDLQSPEDLAEEYFSILLRRCFFQDVEKDDDGDIWRCKMHDLMHDVAQEVAGKEVCTVKTMNGDLDKKVRHVSFITSESANFCFTNKSHARSYLQHGFTFKMNLVCVDALLANWKNLRALGLRRSKFKSLSDSIGELIHLRYLDLSFNFHLEVLPGTITKLCNLQTLDLNRCTVLKELPKDLSKLVKLRVLDLERCWSLGYMPRGMGKLTCLHTLKWFDVGKTSSSKKELFVDVLEDLKALRNLKGRLWIRIGFTTKKKISSGREGGCLLNKEHLKHLELDFDDKEEGEREEYDEAVMEELQPHSNLNELIVRGYHGVRMPRWAREDNLATFLPNLVHLTLRDCRKLQYLGQLRLPQLKILHVNICPDLIAILQCPVLEELKLLEFNERLEIVLYDNGPKLRKVVIDNVAWLNSLPMDSFQGVARLLIETDVKVESLGEAREVFRSCSSSLQSLNITCCFKMKSVVIGGLEHLSALEELTVVYCNLSESEEEEAEREREREYPFCQSLRSLTLRSLSHLPNWIQYLSALQNLKIWRCKELKSMPNWMSKLTSLRELRLKDCSARLKERCQQPTGEDWPHIQHIPSIVIDEMGSSWVDFIARRPK